MSKRKAAPPAPTPAPFHNPFAGLAAVASSLPPGPTPVPAGPSPLSGTAPRRAVVRYERKGHGGKEMTRIQQLGLSGGDLARWLKDAKQGLGCGGVVEGEDLLLQGDQRGRLAAWLTGRGVQKVTVG